ncbi:MAG: M48 family metallopeptidase [Patescibacteria group bacterium]
MYSQIAANKRKTILLVGLFVIFMIGLGWAIGKFGNFGPGSIFLAAIISIVMALFSYYSGDKMAIMTSGARGPIQKTDNPYLWRLVENLCISNGQPMPKLYIIPDPAINAFATGRDPKHASVAVTQGALEKLENEELEGVLAHELSHVKNYDIRVMTIVIVLVGTVSILADWMMRAHLFGSRGDRDRNSNPIFAIIAIVLILLSPIIAEIIKLAVSRRREYLADASGVLLTRFPEGLARALEKISADTRPLARAHTATAHLYIANPFGSKKSLSNLFSTHPPVEDRIQKLRTMGV